MKIKKTLLIAICSLTVNMTFAQKSLVESSKYERSSLSSHFLKFTSNNSISDQSFNAIKVPGNYDDNSFGDNTIKINSSFLEPEFTIKAKNKKGSPSQSNIKDAVYNDKIYALLLNAIHEQKLPNKILARILLDKNNVPTTDVLSKRGEYSATDAQVLKAKNSKEGATLLQQYGLANMLNNVYFSVNQIGEIKSDKGDYTASYKSYLIQIDLKEMLATNFWDEFWWEGNNGVKYNNFMNYNFPTKLISIADGSGLTTDEKTTGGNNVKKNQEEINFDLVSSITEDALSNHKNNYDLFKVRTVVFSTGPITAKIGKKEGLKIDNRFEIFENRESKSGEQFSRKMGYVRVSRVGNNENNADGNSEVSKFYKAPARSVRKNMVMKELSELGIQYGAEIAIGDGFVAPMINLDYVTHLWKGQRVGVSGLAAIQGTDAVTLINFEVKQIFQINRFSFTGGLGYLISPDKGYEDYEGISANFKLGLDFGKNFQINLGPRVLADVGGSVTTIGLGLRLGGF